jgi:hypothetical protein
MINYKKLPPMLLGVDMKEVDGINHPTLWVYFIAFTTLKYDNDVQEFTLAWEFL